MPIIRFTPEAIKHGESMEVAREAGYTFTNPRQYGIYTVYDIAGPDVPQDATEVMLFYKAEADGGYRVTCESIDDGDLPF